MSSQRSFMPKKKEKNITEAFLRLTPPPSILTDGQTDGHTDDGQLGIRKSALPFGWRS